MRHLLAALLVCLAISANAQTVDFGATFHSLDAEATRVITWYADTYAITERGADHRLRTRLFDKRSATVVASAEYDVGDAHAPARLQAEVEAETLVVEQAAAPRRPTAWANTQLRQLWLDQRSRRAAGRTDKPAFITEGGLWRIADVGGPPLTSGPRDDDEGVEALAAEFAGVMAVAQRDRHAPPKRGERVAQSAFTARMYDEQGRQAGFLRWFDKERVLTWSFPNGRRGTAMESRVPGGFKFTPTLAWATVQALAFLRQSARPAPPAVPVPPMAREAQNVAPESTDLPGRGPCAGEAAGQEGGCDGVSDGCTGLHWLDYTIFRECCDAHDKCFERDFRLGQCCEAWSWLFPNPLWHCSRCNFAVASCFYTAGSDPWDALTDRLLDSSARCMPRDMCERCNPADWCDIECASCRTRGVEDGPGR